MDASTGYFSCDRFLPKEKPQTPPVLRAVGVFCVVVCFTVVAALLLLQTMLLMNQFHCEKLRKTDHIDHGLLGGCFF